MSIEMQGTTDRRRWWRRLRVRLSVRALMVCVLVIAGSLGWVVHRANVQCDAVRVIERAGGSVGYDWQFQGGGGGPHRNPRGPTWLRQLLGPDYFDTVTRVDMPEKVTDTEMAAAGRLVHVNRMIINPEDLTDDGFAHLDRMSSLRWLAIAGTREVMDTRIMSLKLLTRLQELYIDQPGISDAELKLLPSIGRLETLSLNGSKVTDQGMACLVKRTGLQNLYLERTQISNEGLEHLRSLRNLKVLLVRRTRVTAEGAKKFQEAVPGVTVLR